MYCTICKWAQHEKIPLLCNASRTATCFYALSLFRQIFLYRMDFYQAFEVEKGGEGEMACLVWLPEKEVAFGVMLQIIV